MIKIDKDKKVSVEFGKGDFAKIHLLAKFDNETNEANLIMKILSKDDVKIGSSGKHLEKDNILYPRVDLNFHEIESIDALIKCLEKLKSNMQFNLSMCSAC